MAFNLFESVDHLQPKCPGCGVTLDFGINTKYSDEHHAHVCEACGHVLKENLDKEIVVTEPAEDEP